MGISVEEINTVLDLQTDSHDGHCLRGYNQQQLTADMIRNGMRSSLHARLDGP